MEERRIMADEIEWITLNGKPTYKARLPDGSYGEVGTEEKLKEIYGDNLKIIPPISWDEIDEGVTRQGYEEDQRHIAYLREKGDWETLWYLYRITY